MPLEISLVGIDVGDIDVFRNISASEYPLLATRLRCIRFNDGEVLFKEGQRQSTLMGVIEGRIRVTKIDKDGSEVPLVYLRRGMSLGEMSLFEDEPRSATAIASGRVVVVEMTRDTYEDLAEKKPRLALKLQEAMLIILSRRLRRTSARFVDLTHE